MAESSISVAVRVRPFSSKEAALLAPIDTYQPFLGDGGLLGSAGAGPSTLSSSPTKNGSTLLRPRYLRPIVRPVDDKVLIFDPQPEGGSAAELNTFSHGKKKPRDIRYAFDRVFDENCGQEDVFANTTKPLLDGLLSGFNASVFAYGATGCGKTHTISGTPEDPGVVFLTMRELYRRVEENKDESDVQIRLSYLEIYNESIRDLLSPSPTPRGQGLMLREDAANRISVVGITEHIPQSPEHVLSMIQEGNQRRTISPTEANAVSSRSHAVLQINITQRPRTANTVMETTSASLNIIDLAGSERAAATNNNGARMKEGANINKSLLALGNCINALCQSGGRNGRHIPYRNSKLTRLLKFSLGGNCKTVMIVCVSPSSAHYDETHNTLKYANQAKNIRTKVSRNMLNVDRHVAQYVQAIHELREEVQSLKSKLAEGGSFESLADKRRKEELATELEDARSRMYANTATIKAHVSQKASVEALLAAARMRVEALQARLTEVNKQAAPFDLKGAAPTADLQEQQQILKRMIARQEGILNDRVLQADQMALSKALQTFKTSLAAAVNNIKFDKAAEESMRRLGDGLVAEVEALRGSVVSDALSKQLMIGAGAAADLSLLCAREIVTGQEAGNTILRSLGTNDLQVSREDLQDLAQQLTGAVQDNAAALYRYIGLKAESTAFAHSSRPSQSVLFRRTRSSASSTASSAARASVTMRRQSVLPAGLSNNGNVLLGASRSPRKAVPRRSLMTSRKNFLPRQSFARSSIGSSSSISSVATAKAIGRARYSSEKGEDRKVESKTSAAVPPSKVIRTSLSSMSEDGDQSTANGAKGQAVASTPSSTVEWMDESQESLDSGSKPRVESASRRNPLGPSNTNISAEAKQRAGNAMFSNNFLRRKESQIVAKKSEPSSDFALDGNSSESLDANDFEPFFTRSSDPQIPGNVESQQFRQEPQDSSSSGTNSDDVARLSQAYNGATVRSSPYRKPSLGKEDSPALSGDGSVGPMRNTRSRSSGSSSASPSQSQQVQPSVRGVVARGNKLSGTDTGAKRMVRASNASLSAAAAAQARAARPSSMLSTQQPFPLRKVPAGGFNQQQQQQSQH